MTGVFDEGRDLGSKSFYSACYAASGSMYFDQYGKVRACCQNTDGVGHVTGQSIREIWESVSAAALRSALAAGDLSVGCGFCAWQAEEVGFSEFARGFDHLDPESLSPQWPLQMEFSMTNSCNLQCVMCNGDLSSSIRVHREHRAPLPEVYGEGFFDELEEFLPHLVEARFLGGEPFLGREPLRVLEMLARLDDPPRVSITTNATQWSQRIEAICERLPVSFVVSLDGITKDTYESIRVGADLDVVMENLLRFRDYARRHGTGISLAHCLMRPNYREFVDLLLFAEDNDMDWVGVNTVLFPSHLSLYQLDEVSLAGVIEEFERIDHGPAMQLERFRPIWDQQLNALRARLQHSGGAVDPWDTPFGPVSLVSPELPLSTSPSMISLDDVGGSDTTPSSTTATVWCSNGLDHNVAGEVVRPILEVDAGFTDLFGCPATSVIGRPISILRELITARFGAFTGEPAVDEHGATASMEADDGRRYDGRVVFVEEGASLRITVTVRPVGAGHSSTPPASC